MRGSEPIRSRVVQAGTLEVVGCILEAWLASKGFAVGPSAGAGAMPRETREQRLARRQAQNEMRQREQEREQALELARALQRQVAVERSLRRERSVTPFTQEVRVLTLWTSWSWYPFFSSLRAMRSAHDGVPE